MSRNFTPVTVMSMRRAYGAHKTDVADVTVSPHPPITLVQNGEKSYTTKELFEGKKVVVFGIPIPVCVMSSCDPLFFFLIPIFEGGCTAVARHTFCV